MTTTPEQIKNLTHYYCEAFNFRNSNVRHKHHAKPSTIAGIIGKSMQTVRQYRADLSTTASRLMPASDMLKLMIERDVRRAASTEKDALKAKAEIETKAKVAMPPFVVRPQGYTPNAYDLIDTGSQDRIVMTVSDRAFAQLVADARGLRVVCYGSGNHDLSNHASLRSRLRQTIFRGRSTLDTAADAYGIDPYDFLFLLTEDRNDAAVPSRKHVQLVEDAVYRRQVA